MSRREPDRLTCPLCGCRLNIRVDGFTCYRSAKVGRPYVKGRVALECSGNETDPPKDAAKRCRYLHTTNVSSDSPQTVAALERAVAKLVLRLPDLGPWQVFKMAEKERKRRA